MHHRWRLSLFDFVCQNFPVHVILELCICIVCRLFNYIGLSAALNAKWVFIMCFKFMEILQLSWLILPIEFTIWTEALTYFIMWSVYHLHGIVNVRQVIGSWIIHNVHCMAISSTATIHDDLVHVGLEKFLLSARCLTYIICSICVFFN